MTQFDTIIKNAHILTLDPSSTVAGSLAVSEGRITQVWKERDPGVDAEHVIDLQGKTLIPGFIDTHNHLLMYSQYLDQINCTAQLNRNVKDIQSRIEEETKHKEKGEWIIGWGYDDTLLAEKRHPTRAELDAVAPDHPVLIRHISSHFAVVNSFALELAEIPEDIQDPKAGHLGRDESGKLDGVLHEFGAMKLVDDVIPDYTVEELASLIEQGANDYLAQGITTNSDAGVGLVKGFLEYKAHVKALAENKNPLKMRFLMLHHLLGEGGPFAGMKADEVDQRIQQETAGRARLDSAKLFQDGSIQGLTGALRQPYFTRPELSGELSHDQDAFNEEVLDLHTRGFRIATHGNGDRAIGSIIDAYSSALQQEPRHHHRHRIEHVQTATIKDLQQMKMNGIQASFFINHVYYWGDRHRDIFLGEERANRLNPLKEAEELGMKFTLHSDCPITPISPLFSIWAAVNRVTSSGEVLGEAQRIDAMTALKSMTIWGARLNFEEEEKGSIEIGKAADFAVLDQDPTTCDPMEIKDIEVEATYIDGKCVFSRAELGT
ncbi:amidohydrolase [Thalassobacillus hwangdonensis]|uniref:Amidohydrolase n=1 Tax=Thalassobacillus hwangdonensis TaxID=546108 RepID=A0ABW3L411_9BACI